MTTYTLELNQYEVNQLRRQLKANLKEIEQSTGKEYFTPTARAARSVLRDFIIRRLEELPPFELCLISDIESHEKTIHSNND